MVRKLSAGREQSRRCGIGLDRTVVAGSDRNVRDGNVT